MNLEKNMKNIFGHSIFATAVTIKKSEAYRLVFPRIPYFVPVLVQSFCMLHVTM